MDDYDYELPPSAIAQTPVEPRDAARLLVARAGANPPVQHRHVRDLADLLDAGDVLVVNETRVLPARLRFRKPTGGAVEVLLLERTDDGWWEALVKPSRKLAPGTIVDAGDGLKVEFGDVVAGRAGGGARLVRLHADGSEDDALARHGVVPLPPYITAPLADPERYQTVYSTTPASTAAPTAGLHLTAELLERCRRRGVELHTVELVVGLDTFRPVTVDDPAEHIMHTERYRVPRRTREACDAARGRVVAVGTTTVRALESAAATNADEGRTDLFVHGDFPVRVVDTLLTNFQLPRSTLLLMLDAFLGGGNGRWRELYDVALRHDYRFLSFGDAMLVDRGVLR
jgi:S-adenosylmethionine:tRNA ribosyltransferase-isomerase